MTADRLAVLLDDALRPYLELLRSPDDQNGKIIRGVAARLAAAGVTVAPDRGDLDVSALVRDLADGYHRLGLVRDHHDKSDTTGWNVREIETCGDPLCREAVAFAAGVTVAPQPDSPAADDGVACNWDENGYCRCRPAPALDVERLREAAQAAAFALDFHNKTPTGRRRSCDPKCIACAAIDALRAALATGDEP